MSPTDNELMEDVRDGRVEKLAVLFERYQTMLYNFFLRLTGNRAASEDLVQEVFVRVLKYRTGYLSESRFNVWLFQIARNAHIDHLRKQKPALSLDEQYRRDAQPRAPARSRLRNRPGGGARPPRARPPARPETGDPRPLPLPEPQAPGDRRAHGRPGGDRQSPGPPGPQGPQPHLPRAPGRRRVMTCEKTQEKFADYLTGDLDEAGRGEVRTHILDCAACREDLENLTVVWAKLGVLPEEQPGSAVRGRFYAMLEDYKGKIASRRGSQRPDAGPTGSPSAVPRSPPRSRPSCSFSASAPAGS